MSTTRNDLISALETLALKCARTASNLNVQDADRWEALRQCEMAVHIANDARGPAPIGSYAATDPAPANPKRRAKK